jgi:hypothetical protein
MADDKSEPPEQARGVEVRTFRTRWFPILMIVCSGIDLQSRIRHPSQRFDVLHHLPLDYGSLLPSTARWIFSAFFDLFFLLFFGSLIPAARSKAEAGLYGALMGVFLLPPLRYFLPGIRVPIWWMECVLDALMVLTGLALFAEVNREKGEKANSPS